MAGELDSEVKKAVEHVEEAMKTNDLSKVMEDLARDRDTRGLNNTEFEQALNKALHAKGLLPQMNIDGLDDKGNVVITLKGDRGDRQMALNKAGEPVRMDVKADAAARPAAEAEQGRVQEAQRPADKHVVKDEKGQVARVDYTANGKSQEFTRDAAGEITKVRNEDNEVWTRGKDNVWTMEGSNPPVTWKGKLYTDDAGNYVKEAADGSKFIERHDGSQVDLNKDGKPTRIETPDGKVTTISYDGKGAISELTAGEFKYTSKDGGASFLVSKNGNDVIGAAYRNLKVGADGRITYEIHSIGPESGLRQTVSRGADGSEVDKNEKGQITRIVDGKGKEFTFGYNDKGQLNAIKNEYGQWKSENGRDWVNEQGQKWSGKVGINDNGDYWYESVTGKRTWNKPDGTKLVEQGTPSDQGRADAPTAGDQPPRVQPPADQPPRPQGPTDQAPRPQGPTDQAPQPGRERVSEQNGVRLTEYADGFKVKDYRDGSQVEINEKGQVTFVKGNPPQSPTRFFEYDQNGQVCKVQGMDNDVWHRDQRDPNLWRSEGGQVWRGKVLGVDADGNAHYAPERGAPFVLTREGRVMPDGGQQGGGTDAHGRHRPGETPQAGDRPQGGRDNTPVAPVENKPAETAEQKAEREKREQAERERKEAERLAAERAKPKAMQPKAFAPKDGVYNPVGPIGIGDSEAGKSYDGEYDTGKGNESIDYRHAKTTDNGDGTVTFTYDGEVEDTGWAPWNWGDTNFTGSQKFTKEGGLLESHVEYDGGKTIKFDTGNGKSQEISDVTKVDTVYNPQTGNYDTVVTTGDGTKYHAVTTQEGKVESFKKATGDTKEDAAGDTNAKVANFSMTEGNYNPVRPRGLGEFRPGQATSGEKNGIDWRESKTESHGDGSTTYNYKGEVEDSGWAPWNWGDTNFSASERIDKNGNVIETHVKYDGSIDQTYSGPNNEKIEIKSVTQADTTLDKDGNFVTQIKNSDGKIWTFTTSKQGKVLQVKRPG